MRALTLTQPWAGLVASGIKLVENRPRPMIKAADFGKPFGIHASREIDPTVYQRIFDAAPDLRTEATANAAWYKLSRVTSAILAVATIREALAIGGCSPETILKALERLGLADQMRFTFGPMVYVLAGDVFALPEPVPCRGWQGFWTMPDAVAAKVNAQFKEAA